MADDKKNQIFPIKVEPACLLKWTWSSVFLNTGTTASCHRTEGYPIDPNNFTNFHNVDEKIRDRTEMLNGRWPGHGCEYCRDVELAGGISDRQFQLSEQKEINQHPPELNQNPIATSVTPTIVEVYFTNACNMACVYCGPRLSSRWEDENRKFKQNFDKKIIDFTDKKSYTYKNPHYEEMVKGLWKYLETDQHYLTLRRFHVLGGEPFIMKEMDDVINFWHEHPNINLLISIVTNLNIPHKRFIEYMKKFERLIKERKIWKIQITASLDAWGPEQEYTRYGLDLSLWEKNFEWLIDKEWVTLSINSTLSALAIKQLPLLIEKINIWNSLRGKEVVTVDNHFNEPIGYSFNTTGIGQYDNLYIFGPGIFDKELKEAIGLMPISTPSQQEIKKQLESIYITLNNSIKNKTKIEELKTYLSTLDQRRNTNWKKTFPWLQDV